MSLCLPFPMRELNSIPHTYSSTHLCFRKQRQCFHPVVRHWQIIPPMKGQVISISKPEKQWEAHRPVDCWAKATCLLLPFSTASGAPSPCHQPHKKGRASLRCFFYTIPNTRKSGNWWSFTLSSGQFQQRKLCTTWPGRRWQELGWLSGPQEALKVTHWSGNHGTKAATQCDMKPMITTFFNVISMLLDSRWSWHTQLQNNQLINWWKERERIRILVSWDPC